MCFVKQAPRCLRTFDSYTVTCNVCQTPLHLEAETQFVKNKRSMSKKLATGVKPLHIKTLQLTVMLAFV